MASKTYTINSVDTWERKSVTLDGATGFSLTNGNTEGLMVDWWYHSGTDYSSGSVSETYITLVAANYNAGATANLGDNTSNYLRMTGVQLEVGDTATPFEHRSFGEELAACQRYYEIIGSAGTGDIVIGGYANNNTFYETFQFKAEKRAAPTVTKNGTWSTGGTGVTQPQVYSSSKILFRAGVSNVTGPGNAYVINNQTGCNFTADAEI